MSGHFFGVLAFRLEKNHPLNHVDLQRGPFWKKEQDLIVNYSRENHKCQVLFPQVCSHWLKSKVKLLAHLEILCNWHLVHLTIGGSDCLHLRFLFHLVWNKQCGSPCSTEQKSHLYVACKQKSITGRLVLAVLLNWLVDFQSIRPVITPLRTPCWMRILYLGTAQLSSLRDNLFILFKFLHPYLPLGIFLSVTLQEQERFPQENKRPGWVDKKETKKKKFVSMPDQKIFPGFWIPGQVTLWQGKYGSKSGPQSFTPIYVHSILTSPPWPHQTPRLRVTWGFYSIIQHQKKVERAVVSPFLLDFHLSSGVAILRLLFRDRGNVAEW